MFDIIPFDLIIHSPLPEPYLKIHILTREKNYIMDFHTHEKLWHLNYITEGSMDLYMGDKHITVHKNQLVIFPPQIPHKIVSEEGYQQIGVDVSVEDDDRNISRMLSAYFTTYPLAINVAPLSINMEKGVELLRNPTPLNITTFINQFEKTILEALDVMASNKNTISSRLTQIIQDNNPFTLTLSDICRITNYSKTQIERLAVKELGCGISAYLNNIRLNKICSLLQSSDYTMAQIAEMTGLYDASHLTTFFKKHMGITPGKFRSNHINYIE